MRQRKIYRPESLVNKGSQGSQKGYRKNMHKKRHVEMVIFSEKN